MKRASGQGAHVDAWASLDERKAAIRGLLVELGAAAEVAGPVGRARHPRDAAAQARRRARFNIVVLGEFNHGKSTFINALLGGPVLPTGITPTTAVLSHIPRTARRWGRRSLGGVGRAQGRRRQAARGVAHGRGARQGRAREGRAAGEGVHHVELTHPAAILGDRVSRSSTRRASTTSTSSAPRSRTGTCPAPTPS